MAIPVLLAACGRASGSPAGRVDRSVPTAAASPILGLGRPPTPEEVREMDRDVEPDGSGLPAGGGSAADGEPVFAARCSGCHGPRGEGAAAIALAGGTRPAFGYRVGRPPPGEPPPSLVDFYPFATTLFDYTRRAMPWNAPGSLSDNETYSLVAWMLWRNQLVEKSTFIDRNSLWRVQMPARARFAYPDYDGGANHP